MANNKKRPAQTPASSAKAPATPKASGRASQPAKANEKQQWYRSQHVYFIGGIVILTWLYLSVCLQNQFTNWDDPGYIKDNHIIKDLSMDGLKAIFTEPIMGNYHPITILTYALEYSKVRLDPWLYHFDSLLFHILVTVAVYVFVVVLTKRNIAGAICALLFGLHPMHVESIAWLAGRKDVVYGLFYMLALTTYVLYARAQNEKKWQWYGSTILLFVLALLSKPVAVSLPVTLLVIDYFEKRKLDVAMLLDKVPFFMLSILAGIKSVSDQKQFGALNSLDVTFNPLERIALGGYALCSYLWKAILPLKLSCYYEYPSKVGDSLPVYYFVFPAIVIVLAGVIYFLLRKNRVVIFGVLFFLVNIALLLQFIPVGGAIIADRYSYIPFLGLFFIPAYLISGFFEPGSKLAGYKNAAIGIIGVYCLFLGYLSREKCMTWYDSVSLWRDEIAEFPRTPNAYNNLGFNYFDMFNNTADLTEKKRYYDSSYYLLSKAIELQPKFVNPYVSLGELERSIGKFDEAKAHYYKAKSLNPKEPNLYLGLAIIYSISQKFDSAAYCFKTALTLKPFFPEAHGNYGNFLDMTGNADGAIAEYGTAIAQNPDGYAFYLNRGRAYMNRKKDLNQAMKDFNAAAEVNPTDGEIFYTRAMCFANSGNKAMAVQDLNKAISLGFRNIDPGFAESLKH